MSLFLLAFATISAQCVAIDGDTLSCLTDKQRRVHIRLGGIDAPELPGHCRGVRKVNGLCAPGDPFKSKASLKSLVDGQMVTWRSLGIDPYGRTVALPRAGGQSLSCAQLQRGQAVLVTRWDKVRGAKPGRTLAKTCSLMK